MQIARGQSRPQKCGRRKDALRTAAAPGKVAVVGAGLAGLATAWHLLDAAAREGDRRVQVHVFDAVGIGAGGSGAAAGLLHPFTPRGKLLWRGEEAYAEAVALLEAAEAAEAGAGQPLAWRHGVLMPAMRARQAADFAAAAVRGEAGGGARAVDAEAAAELVPGIALPALQPPPPSQAPLQQQQQPPTPDLRHAAALYVPHASTLHPHRYMRALWRACQLTAAERCAPGSGAWLHAPHPLASLSALQQHRAGPFDAAVVAAGAAVGCIAECAPLAALLELCQGYTVDLEPPDGDGRAGCCGAHGAELRPGPYADAARAGGGGVAACGAAPAAGAYPPDAPSLLGTPYLASQGGSVLVVGATQQQGWSSAQALAECGRRVEWAGGGGGTGGEVGAAVSELRARAAGVWPPARAWRVAGVRSGVRARPPRSPLGALPLLGRWHERHWAHLAPPPSPVSRPPPLVWVVGGLGARGLVYHAWLGRLAAQAVNAGSDAGVPRELLTWQVRLERAG